MLTLSRLQRLMYLIPETSILWRHLQQALHCLCLADLGLDTREYVIINAGTLIILGGAYRAFEVMGLKLLMAGRLTLHR